MSLQKELIDWSKEPFSSVSARLRSGTGKSVEEVRKALSAAGFDEQKAKARLLKQQKDTSLVAKQARW